VNDKNEILTRIKSVEKLLSNPLSFPVEKIIGLVEEINLTFRRGNKIAFVGNGGSAAESIHLAAEFTGKCVNDHVPLPAISLNQSISSMTAIANDYGFENIFSRQVEAELSSGDLMIALSTSGKSTNILRALETANKKNVKTYLWTGQNEIKIEGVEIMKAPSNETPRIQEIHLIWGHIVAETVELSWVNE
jgi:D-sedoheptulose 7-phosphate isomerase